MLKIVEKTKLWISISLVVIIMGAFFIAFKGLEYGIDFAGGTIVQIDMKKDFDKQEIEKIITQVDSKAIVNKAITDNNGKNIYELEIKSKDLSTEKTNDIINSIKAKHDNSAEVISQEEIGANVGKETARKAILAMLIATACMLIYVGIRFEFKFGTAAILALVHDVLVTLAIYAIFRIPIDTGFVAAVLTVIGYSINDTIVVFDRIRENKKYMAKADLSTLANASITQTLTRSINTVLTVVITLISVFIFVPTVRNFSGPLLIGIISGSYSSIFIASPLWVIFKKMGKNSKTKKAAVR